MPEVQSSIWMYQTMVLSRCFEDAIKEAYMEGKTPRFNMADGPIPGEMHLSSGQEPCAVGICAHLKDYDVVTATHRAHHIAIAKGVNLEAMTAEIFGRETGLSAGKGGHMHLFDAAVNFSCSGIIGEGLGPAVGAALARKLRGEPGIAVAFLGEGAANQGAFHEALNLAAVWRVGVVFVIEDNAWGISVGKGASTAVPSNALRAQAYGMPGERIPGNDPQAIFMAAQEAVARARDGGGPTLLELETLRMEGHFMGDAEQYRSEAEREGLAALDPIVRTRAQLIEAGELTEQDAQAIHADAASRVEAAIAKAKADPLPAAEDALRNVFVGA